jgi:DNA-binding CsgD family transcriptional regulator
MRMGFIDVRPDDHQEWHLHTIHEMENMSAMRSAELICADNSLKALPNQDYVNNYMMPRLEMVISTQEPSIAFVKSAVGDTIIGFDSLYLPQKNLTKPEWVIFIANMRFALKEVELKKLDKTDAAIIQLLIEGETAKEIAITLKINHRTIEYRIARLKTMMGAKNTIQLVALLIGNQMSSVIADQLDLTAQAFQGEASE